MKILKANENVDIKFAFYMMQYIKFDASLHKRYWISQYSKIKIPLPPLKVQEQIVTEVAAEQQAIEECKTLITRMEQKIKAKIATVWEE